MHLHHPRPSPVALPGLALPLQHPHTPVTSKGPAQSPPASLHSQPAQILFSHSPEGLQFRHDFLIWSVHHVGHAPELQRAAAPLLARLVSHRKEGPGVCGLGDWGWVEGWVGARSASMGANAGRELPSWHVYLVWCKHPQCHPQQHRRWHHSGTGPGLVPPPPSRTFRVPLEVNHGCAVAGMLEQHLRRHGAARPLGCRLRPSSGVGTTRASAACV